MNINTQAICYNNNNTGNTNKRMRYSHANQHKTLLTIGLVFLPLVQERVFSVILIYPAIPKRL